MRWRRGHGLSSLWIALAWSWPLALQAQVPRPPAQASAGEAAYAQGDFEGALHAFERAYAESKEPRMLFRIGDVADKLGLHARAAAAFEQYVRAAPASKDRAFVESRLRANQSALGMRPPPSAAQAAARAPARELGIRLPPSAATAPAPEPTASWFTAANARARTAEGDARAEDPRTAQPERRGLERAALEDPAFERRGSNELSVTAHTPERAPQAALGTAARATESSSVSSQVGPWWLWAGAGGVVVAGIVVAALALGSATTSPEPLRGNLGSAVHTLARP